MKKQSKGNPLVGCLLVIAFGVIFYWAVWLAPNEVRRTTPSSSKPTATSSNYGQVIDVADEMVVMPSDVVFYQCQQLRCAEAGTIAKGQRVLITKMIGGEMVNGMELWVVAEDSYGGEAYAPIANVFPPYPRGDK